MTFKEYLAGLKQAHSELGMPVPDEHVCEMLADCWHKSAQAEHERVRQIIIDAGLNNPYKPMSCQHDAYHHACFDIRVAVEKET